MWERTVNEAGAKIAAYELVQLYSIADPKDIVLEDIAMAQGVLVIEGHLDGAEARLIRKGPRGIIRINYKIPEIGRKRFAIAHELGHWELHQNITQMDLYSESGMLSYSSDPVENEANIFASELLMPTKLYRPLCENETPNLQTIKKLATDFSTTLSSAAVRFVEESSYPCAVVFSANGEVVWWRRSDSCENIWFERKQEIHQESLAWDCLNGNAVSEQGERVPVEAWIRNERHCQGEQIFEQSLKLGRYPMVLSLLWFDY